MRQAQVSIWGLPPRCTQVPEPPEPTLDEVRINVKAVGIHRLVRSRASGQHYSISNTSGPHVPGIDGVGFTEEGKPVYWVSLAVGALSEKINVPRQAISYLNTGFDLLQAAAIINPAMSSWMAMKTRVDNLPSNFTVLILGATTASGRMAISLARSLGAKRVIGVGRDRCALESLGLDDRIVLTENVPSDTDFSIVGDVDVILDYLFGPIVVHLFRTLKSSRPVQYVQIGSLADQEIMLPAAILRSQSLSIRGSGLGAWTVEESTAFMPEVLRKLEDLPKQPIEVRPIEEVEKTWQEKRNARLVISFD